MFKRIISLIVAFFQMAFVSIMPIDYSGDEVFPNERNPMTTEHVYASRDDAVQAGGGWYEVLIDDFDYASKEEMEQTWDYAVHGAARSARPNSPFRAPAANRFRP